MTSVDPNRLLKSDYKVLNGVYDLNESKEEKWYLKATDGLLYKANTICITIGRICW